jgi:light-regulated signal transduction histidine kinase (bacteriophytochrome)
MGASKTAYDITNRIVAAEERQRQEEQLLRSNADLQRFAYAASHDRREPPRTISVYTQSVAANLKAATESPGALVTFVSLPAIKGSQMNLLPAIHIWRGQDDPGSGIGLVACR